VGKTLPALVPSYQDSRKAGAYYIYCILAYIHTATVFGICYSYHFENSRQIYDYYVLQ